MTKGTRIMQIVSAKDPSKASKMRGFVKRWCGLCEILYTQVEILCSPKCMKHCMRSCSKSCAATCFQLMPPAKE
eukprot:CAMPEP_0197659266 /NCGR_PEP_ID=MMETSP1338-20131121/46945_1 /TAXON_ID=43686 ORGANISM="Pelagodinium beii, Strain RCC1491" /NCGR_SAMPLE_ID=MMETSP1338 /ASSEMBLY_ACC=CAM_ASM_000754 /LENGTH=73 /DNA_ID=CAMNT_0043236111 /DNA_START=361 /DNA_END=582 /DNA_ORIENTATION=-